MRKLFIITLLLFFSICSFAQETPPLPPGILYDQSQLDDLKKAVGDTVTVSSRIFSGKYLMASSLTLLNVGADYPNQKLTLIIKGANRNKFNGKPEVIFKGKDVTIRGVVTDYNGKPQIIITDPNQIEILGLTKVETPY